METFTESRFPECHARYRGKVRGYVLSMVPDREDAEDSTRDVFEHIWRCRERIRKATLHGLVRTVARNTVADHLRRHCVRNGRTDMRGCREEQYGRNAAEEDCHHRELLATHGKMAERLSGKRHQAYLLHFYEGMPHASIAGRLGVPERTVGGHLLGASGAVRAGVERVYGYKAE